MMYNFGAMPKVRMSMSVPVRYWLPISICSAAAVWFSAAAPTVTKGNLDGFDDFMAKAMREFKVPGAAVAVVKAGTVLLAKGYGYRDAAPTARDRHHAVPHRVHYEVVHREIARNPG